MGIKHRHATSYRTHQNGSMAFYTPGPFASLAKVEDCPCEDGVRRTAHATAEADTFFSIPACVYVTVARKCKTVSGFLSHNEEGWRFTVDRGGVNQALVTAPDPPEGESVTICIAGLEPEDSEDS